CRYVPEAQGPVTGTGEEATAVSRNDQIVNPTRVAHEAADFGLCQGFCFSGMLQTHSHDLLAAATNGDQFLIQGDGLAILVGHDLVAAGTQTDFLRTSAGDHQAAV